MPFVGFVSCVACRRLMCPSQSIRPWSSASCIRRTGRPPSRAARRRPGRLAASIRVSRSSRPATSSRAELRTRRGADPARPAQLAPELTPQQREALSRVEVVLAMDLPFDVASAGAASAMGAGDRRRGQPACVRGARRRRYSRSPRRPGSTPSRSVNSSSRGCCRCGSGCPRSTRIASRTVASRRTAARSTGLTLGVVGLGAIGRQVARRARALGLSVIAQRRSADAR